MTVNLHGHATVSDRHFLCSAESAGFKPRDNFLFPGLGNNFSIRNSLHSFYLNTKPHSVGPRYFRTFETRRKKHTDIPRVPHSVAYKHASVPTANILSRWHVQRSLPPRYASGYANYTPSIGAIDAYISDIPRYPYQQFDILSKRNLSVEKAYRNVDRVAQRSRK